MAGRHAEPRFCMEAQETGALFLRCSRRGWEQGNRSGDSQLFMTRS